MSRSTKDNVEEILSILWDREKAFEEAVNDDADAEHVFKIKNARCYLAAEGTEKARAAQALLDCEKEHLAYLKKKAVREFTKEKLRDAQDALSARQSLLSYDAKTNFAYTGGT